MREWHRPLFAKRSEHPCEVGRNACLAIPWLVAEIGRNAPDELGISGAFSMHGPNQSIKHSNTPL